VQWLSPPRGWRRFAWRFAALLVAFLLPWPGLASFFSAATADALGACAALLGGATGLADEVRFVAGHYPDHPWFVQLAVKNVFTTASFDIPIDTRTVAYVRIAVFVALAAAWPIARTRRALSAAVFGLALLLALIAFSVLLPTLQVLELVGLIKLGTALQSLISVGIMTLVTYPSMAFAVPAFVWLSTLYVARVSAPARAPRSIPVTSA